MCQFSCPAGMLNCPSVHNGHLAILGAVAALFRYEHTKIYAMQCSLDCLGAALSALINSNRVRHLRISMKHAVVSYTSRFLFNLDMYVRCSHCRQIINVNQRTATTTNDLFQKDFICVNTHTHSSKHGLNSHQKEKRSY